MAQLGYQNVEDLNTREALRQVSGQVDTLTAKVATLAAPATTTTSAFVWPAILPTADARNLANLNASQLLAGTVPLAVLPVINDTIHGNRGGGSLHTAATTSLDGFLVHADWNTFNNKAPTASPTFTGVPLSTTAAVDTNTTQIATTAFVIGQAYLKSATAASTYAPIASPAFTGVPAAPTAAGGTNTTQLATTAFVQAFTGTANITNLGTVTTGTWNAGNITAAGYGRFELAQNGGTDVRSKNTQVGATAWASLSALADVTNFSVYAFSSGYTSTATRYQPSQVTMEVASGGFNFSSEDTSPFKWFINNNLRMTIDNSGLLTVAGGGSFTGALSTTGAWGAFTTLGDLQYSAASGVATRLAGNTTATKKFLRQTGTGAVSAAPAWDTVTSTDVGLGSVENTALSTWAGTSNVTTLGTIATGTWSATTVALNKGGTGQTTKAAAFDALQPMTTLGDLVYGGVSGTGTRLAGDTSNANRFLRSVSAAGVAAAPSWQALVSGDIPNNAANTTGTAGGLTGTPAISVGAITANGNITIDGFTSGYYLSTRLGFAPNAAGGAGLMAGDHSGANNDGLDVYGHDGIGFWVGQAEKGRFSPGGKFLINTTTDNGTDIAQFNGSIICSQLKTTQTASASTKTVTHSVPIVLNGTTYDVLLSSTGP